MEPIIGSPGIPFIGNLLDLKDDEAPLRALEHLADVHGPVIQLRVRGDRTILVSSAEVMREVMDEKLFVKVAPPALAGVPGSRGLFTAANEDPGWGQAHRILMPAFGPLAIGGMFEDMKDIANQLILKWARNGGNHSIHVTDDYTRLTLDTIALCTMDYRFNSFYQDAMHPFVAAMINILQRASTKFARPAFMNKLSFLTGSPSKEREDATLLYETVNKIIQHRRSNPVDQNDLLNTLLNGKDPKTGQKMSDDLIGDNMITFLVAGHETTSGLISFATVYLLQNPQAYQEAQEEVDAIIGKDSIQLSHISKLKYIEAVLRETLRLTPTAPGISKQIRSDRAHEVITLSEGKYRIKPTDRIFLLLTKCMQDPKVFGDDAHEFKPERMLAEHPNYEEHNKYWKPFGNGSRACIGRSFAMQEAILALAMVLQNFDLRLEDPTYNMKIKQTLTIKPLDVYMRATLRDGISAVELDRKLHNGSARRKSIPLSPEVLPPPSLLRPPTPNGGSGQELTILYGSNTGTCQALAQKLASEASATYNLASKVLDLDSCVGGLPTNQPTVIITASYEGEPTDNAAQFVEWLQKLQGDKLKDVQYAVFGCGNSDWQGTFQRIPKLINDAVKARGGEQLAELGSSDVARGNPNGDFETWLDQTLWPALAKKSVLGQTKSSPAATQGAVIEVVPAPVPVPILDAEISTGSRATTLRHDVQLGTVKDVKILTAPGEPPKRHLEVELPAGTSYECGDYLAVLPQNPEVNVRKIMAHFGLPWDAVITLRAKSFAPLPLDVPLSVADILRNYVELSQPATKRAVSLCAKHATADKAVQEELSRLATDDSTFQTQIATPRTSIFGLLTQHPSIALPFPTFLSLLLPLSVRQYSISSSPLHNPSTCTISYAVVGPESAKNRHQTQNDTTSPFFGVASTYLSTLSVNDKIHVSIRRTANPTFRIPSSPSTPLIMFAAGTGLAPFLGFIQHRAAQLSADPSLKLGKALLFLGCRSQTRDRLYAAQMDEWISNGVVDVRYAFSQDTDKSEGCKYVGDRMARPEDEEEMVRLWKGAEGEEGARVYVCGSRGFANEVRKAVEGIVKRRKESGVAAALNAAGGEERFWEQVKERAASDVFD